MSQSSLNGLAEINEEGTAVYVFQLQDEDSVDIVKTDLADVKVRVIDIETGAVVQGDTSILGDVSATGLVDTLLPASYFNFQGTTKKPTTIEQKLIIFITTYGSKVDVHHLRVDVHRSTETA